jgi:hypothetical protein
LADANPATKPLGEEILSAIEILRQSPDLGWGRADACSVSLAFFSDLLKFEETTPASAGEKKDQQPPSRNEWQSYAPVRFVLTAPI